MMLPIIIPDAVFNAEGQYASLYASDRISLDRLTIDIGVRFDRSTSSLLEASRPASPLVPDLLPALNAPAISNTHVFNTFAPRIGVSYALGEESDTLLRASYGQFAAQLAAGASNQLASPVAGSDVYYLAVDANGDGLPQPEEILFGNGIVAANGFDPANPTSTDSVNLVARDLSSPLTHELIFGMDRELPIPNSAVTTSVTYRRFTNRRWSPYIGMSSADFGVVDTITATLPSVGGGRIGNPGRLRAAGGPATRQRHRGAQPGRLPPGVLGLGGQPRQASEQPLDGAHRLLVQRPPGVLHRPDGGHPRPDADADQSEA